MKKVAVSILGLLLLVALMTSAGWAHQLVAQPGGHKVYDPDNVTLATGDYSPAAALDTIWYGFITGGTMSNVGPGGMWTFDVDSAGNTIGDPGVGSVDSAGWHASVTGIRAMQGWTGMLSQVQCEAFSPPDCYNEPDTYMNYGNVGTFWHQQNMTTIAKRASQGGFNANINGAGVLWCGLDGTQAANLLSEFEGSDGITCAVNFPGYGDMWDQLVVKDVSVPNAGGTTMVFKYATDMDITTEAGLVVAGPHQNDPTFMQNGSLFDELDVYVGNPVSSVIHSYDNLTALVGASPTLLEGPLKGLSDSTGTSLTTAAFGNGVGGIGQTARIVFRIRSNRTNSDEGGTVTYDGTIQRQGTNFGAAMIDDVYFTNGAHGLTNGVADPGGADGNGIGSAYNFNANMQGWVACAKQLPLWAHIFNVGNNDPNVNGLGYDVGDPNNKWADPCGVPGQNSSLCNMKNNTLATFDPYPLGTVRDHYSSTNWPIHVVSRGESPQGATTPDIDVTSGGLPIGRAGGVGQYDVYSYNPLEEGVLYQTFVRYKTNPAQVCPGYSAWQWRNTQFYNPAAACATTNFTASAIIPMSTATHIQMMIAPDDFCWQTGNLGVSGTCTANFTPLFDNVRFGLVNTVSAPAMTIQPWEFPQDAYPGDDYPSKRIAGSAGRPSNYWAMQKRFGAGSARYDQNHYAKTLSVDGTSGVIGGLTLNIDGQTAVFVGAKNISQGPNVPPGTEGENREDSIQVNSAFSSKGTRLDCVFRVVPGPLTDTTDAWFNAFKANTGVMGSGGNQNPAAPVTGKHGGGTSADHWRWYVWNSVQMDTAESDRWDTTATVPSVQKGSGAWSNTVHEADPHYGVAGVTVNHELPRTNPTTPFAWINEHSTRFTDEHSPIFPSYLFTPGTLINFFYRSCFNSTPTVFVTLPDTTGIINQGGNTYTWRCLPNAWNDFARYGANTWTGEVGKGRACTVFIDHSNGFPNHFSYKFAMDSLGIIADEYSSQAPSSAIGSFGDGAMDLAAPQGPWQHYGSCGPTISQLVGYSDVFWTSGTLNTGTLQDANDQDPSCDVQLLSTWLNGTPSGGHRIVWLNGTGMSQYLDIRRPGASPGGTFAKTELGILDNSTDDGSTNGNYRAITLDNTECPTIVPAGNSSWGLTATGQKISVAFNFCLLNYDILAPNTGGSGSTYSSQLYPVASPNTGTRGTGVVHDYTTGSGGQAIAFTDALDFARVRDVNCRSNYGRIHQMRTVYYKLGAVGATPFCNTTFAQTSVNPGGPSYTTALFQNTPNPFRPSRATSIHYSVGRSAGVNLNIHDVSGRLVRTLVNAKREPGEYTANFDGRDNDGRQLAAGVYFYRLKVGDFESNKKMLMLK